VLSALAGAQPTSRPKQQRPAAARQHSTTAAGGGPPFPRRVLSLMESRGSMQSSRVQKGASTLSLKSIFYCSFKNIDIYIL
jgi:hypothetical protein